MANPAPSSPGVACQSCGRTGWPYQEMNLDGSFASRCSNDECRAIIVGTTPREIMAGGSDAQPDRVIEPQQSAPVVPLFTTPPTHPMGAPIMVPSSPPTQLGVAEITYARAVLSECESLAAQLNQRIARLSALLR